MGTTLKEEQRARGIADLLEAAGFKPIGDDDSLWSKDGNYYYGKEAALQQAWRKLREGDDNYAEE